MSARGICAKEMSDTCQYRPVTSVLKIAAYRTVVIGIDRGAVVVALHPHVTCWHFTPPRQLIAIDARHVITRRCALLHRLQQRVVFLAQCVRVHADVLRRGGVIHGNYALDQLASGVRGGLEADDVPCAHLIWYVAPAIDQHQIRRSVSVNSVSTIINTFLEHLLIVV
jgi:hypothetical protein